MQKLFGLRRGSGGEDISDYEGRTGSAGDMTVYEGDLGRSKRLKSYREKYGAALDNEIIGENMRLFGGSYGMGPGGYQGITGKGMFTDAQELTLRRLDAEAQYEENVAANRGLRATYKKKNPMMFGG